MEPKHEKIEVIYCVNKKVPKGELESVTLLLPEGHTVVTKKLIAVFVAEDPKEREDGQIGSKVGVVVHGPINPIDAMAMHTAFHRYGIDKVMADHIENSLSSILDALTDKGDDKNRPI